MRNQDYIGLANSRDLSKSKVVQAKLSRKFLSKMSSKEK